MQWSWVSQYAGWDVNVVLPLSVMCWSHISDNFVHRMHWLTQCVLQYLLVLPKTLFLNFISLGSLIHLSILSSAIFLNILNILGQNNGEKEHLWTNVEWTDCFLRTGEYLKLFFFLWALFLKVIYCNKIQSQLNVDGCFICIL